MKKNKILVTGGLGFIGSHTVVELQKKGFDVMIIDDLSNTRIEVLDGITAITNIRPEFVQMDLKEKEEVASFFAQHSIDGVIHFAASKAVGESVEQPLKYYENNISTLVYLLKSMIENKVPHLIFSSSCTVYGQADELPITENAPVKKAESPYGNTKQMGEEIIEDVTKVANLNAIALRYFNPIGAHESVEIGELPLGVPQNLIPYVTQTAAGIREELSVFGDDYPTPDGTAIRDYIHVVDLAKAHIVAMERLLAAKNKSKMEYFNLGTGTGSSVLDVINAFKKANDIEIKYKIVARREGDITAAYANTKLANEELGWKAELGLKEALASAWQWQLKQQ